MTTDDEKIKLEAFQYLEVAEHVHKSCSKRFDEYLDVKELCYDKDGRVKSKERVLEKIKSNNLSGPGELKDLSGFRFITYFSNDIADVVFLLISRINSLKTVDVRIHSSRPASDPLSVAYQVERRLSGVPNVNVNTQGNITNYSSVHIVFSEAVSPSINDIKEIFVEIQVRSILEELWGEIDHRLRYTVMRGGGGENWQRHLNILKTLIDGVMQYIDEIKIQSDQASNWPPAEVRRARSVNTPEREMERLKGLPGDLRVKLVDAYDSWRDADKTKNDGGDPKKFLKAALAFSNLRESAGDYDLASELAQRFVILTMAEEAYMLLYTGIPGDLSEVVRLCHEIIKLDNKNVVAHYRLGLAKRRLREFKEARKNLEIALELVESGVDPIIDTTHELHFDIRRALSILDWKIFQSTDRPDAERVAALTSAIQIAKDDYVGGAGETKRDALNDFLYYCWEHRNALREDSIKGLPSEFVTDDDFENYCSELSGMVGDGDAIYELWDTLQRVYLEIGNRPKAIEFAIKVREKLEQRALRKDPNLNLPEDRSSYAWTGRVLDALNDDDQKDTLIFAQDLLRSAKS